MTNDESNFTAPMTEAPNQTAPQRFGHSIFGYLVIDSSLVIRH